MKRRGECSEWRRHKASFVAVGEREEQFVGFVEK